MLLKNQVQGGTKLKDIDIAQIEGKAADMQDAELSLAKGSNF